MGHKLKASSRLQFMRDLSTRITDNRKKAENQDTTRKKQIKSVAKATDKLRTTAARVDLDLEVLKIEIKSATAARQQFERRLDLISRSWHQKIKDWIRRLDPLERAKDNLSMIIKSESELLSREMELAKLELEILDENGRPVRGRIVDAEKGLVEFDFDLSRIAAIVRAAGDVADDVHYLGAIEADAEKENLNPALGEPVAVGELEAPNNAD